TDADLGVACYHSKTGATVLFLNHLVDGPDEYVVVDMTAGSDSFASGSFTRFDLTFLVAEPTRKDVSVFRQYKEYALDFGVALKVVGNKVQGPDDLDFLRAEAGDDLLVTMGHSDWVRALEKGRPPRFDLLGEPNRRALRGLPEAVDPPHDRRDRERYMRQMAHFHLKNAQPWGNERTGVDLPGAVGWPGGAGGAGRGRPARFGRREEPNRRALRVLREAVDATYERRDRERYMRQMVHFHLKNAQSWGNERTGADLAAQVDPSFVLGESVTATA